MTLIVAVGNPHFVAQLSDRRLTSVGGASPGVVTDESNKATVWEVPSGRFLIGYTGITSEEVRSNAQFIVNDLLIELAPKFDFRPWGTIDALADALSKTLAKKFRGVPARSRHLTVMFTGLLEKGDGISCFPVQALVTNYQKWGVGDSIDAWDHFEVTFCWPSEGVDWPTIVQRVGAWPVFKDSEGDDLRELLKPGVPPRAVIGKMVSLLPNWSARSGGVVGIQSHSLLITADRSAQPVEKYHFGSDSNRFFGTSRLVTTPEMSFAFADLEIKVIDP